ncbi:MAG: hypothetical protein QXU32_05355 [Nitrososphaerales archaeon]
METNLTYEKRSAHAAIVLAVLIIGAVTLAQTAVLGFAQVSNEAFQAIDDCHNVHLPDNDLGAMTTVVGTRNGSPVAKTVHAEKQWYLCELDQGEVPVIVEQTIYMELVENLNTKNFLQKSIQVVTCVTKISDAAVIGCNREVPPTDLIVTQACQEDGNGDEIPVELNMVVNPQSTNIVKVIEAEKIIFGCDFVDDGGPFGNTTIELWDDTPIGDLDLDDFKAGGDFVGFTIKKVDRVLFTELWQDLNNLKVVKKTAVAGICVIHLTNDTDGDGEFDPKVESCRFVNVSI